MRKTFRLSILQIYNATYSCVNLKFLKGLGSQPDDVNDIALFPSRSKQDKIAF